MDILHQPGVDSASIQLQPSSQLAAMLPGPIKQDNTPTVCPKGNVEMRLPSREAMVRAGSLKNFFLKYQDGLNQNIVAKTVIRPKSDGFIHEHATYSQSVAALAAQTTLNIWKPIVASGEMSLSQLWVLGGSGTGLQSLEVGYQVSNRFTDTLPHLFIYSTTDGYATGCYDLSCPAATRFVKTSNVLDFGGALTSRRSPN
ncbi:MAG: neprosin family prolyl endopeptidase [Methylococcales bacterium]